jgi:UDP-galactopyranose mutase
VADTVVVGAGLGGMAAAARLSKLGHRVTVLERRDEPGGAFRVVERDGIRWDAGPTGTALPAVLRDLFRKSGRPLERYVELVMRTPARRHVFDDGTHVDLAVGSRGAQLGSVAAGLGDAPAAAWTSYVDGLGEVWDTLRQQVLDPEHGGRRLGDRDVARALQSRSSVHRLVRRSLKDDRLRAMAWHPFVLAGSDPRDVPAYEAVTAYVDRTFGVWTAPGGLAQVTAALHTRLDERRVDLRLGTEVTAIEVAGARVAAVRTAAGERFPADLVVSAADLLTSARLLGDDAPPELRSVVQRAAPATPFGVTHLGLRDEGLPDLPDEVVLYGEPLLVLHTAGVAPEGHRAWTVWRRGSALEDVAVSLARRRIDVRRQIVTRVDRGAVDIVGETSGSPLGLAWRGWRSAVDRAALIEPVRGLHLVGASVFPGAGMPYVAWGAAQVAARVGKA